MKGGGATSGGKGGGSTPPGGVPQAVRDANANFTGMSQGVPPAGGGGKGGPSAPQMSQQQLANAGHGAQGIQQRIAGDGF